MIKKLRIICGWFFSGMFLLGFLIGIKSVFTEPVMSLKFLGIVIAVTNLFVAYVFYIIGPGWEVFLEKRKLKAMKREEEAKQKEEESKQEEAKQIERSKIEAQQLQKLERRAKEEEESKQEEARQIERSKIEAQQLQKLERRAKKEEARQKKLERRAKEEEKLQELCLDENEWKSFKKNQICVGMHILVVQEIKGTKHDEKRNVSAKNTILKYKYGQSRNQKGNWSYELEVTFEDDRVTAFKDL